MDHKFCILVLNGPNLNLLGQRETKIYGEDTLSDVMKQMFALGEDLGVSLNHFQSNAEHELVNCLHSAYNNINFIIVNPAALTHTSIVLRDAFLSVKIPFIEVHLSNIYTRESFRRYSYLSDIAVGVICGFGVNVYYYALDMAVKYLVKSRGVIRT